MARRRATPLDIMKMFVATPMELVALGDAIHFYMDAAQCGQLSQEMQEYIVPLLVSFQSRLVAQLEEGRHL